MPPASPLPAPAPTPFPASPALPSFLPPSGECGELHSLFFGFLIFFIFWVRVGSRPWLPPALHPAPVRSWENAEINKYAIRQASSRGGGRAAKRGSGQILECLRKRLELWASAGLRASHRPFSPPNGEGVPMRKKRRRREGGSSQPCSWGAFPPLASH